MGNPKAGGSTATWETNDVLIFCDLCIIEIGLGNRPTTHFSKNGWKNLIESFKQRTGKNYDRLQMKNKWDHLKKDWKLWKELKHGETGLGWDQEKKTIAASDQWWDDKIKVVPAAKKFRFAGIAPDLEEKLNIMFSQVVATGEDSWAPSIGSVPQDVEHISDEEDNPVENLEVQRLDSSTNIGNTSTSTSKRRKMRKNKGVALSYMSELRASVLADKPPPIVTIKEAVDLICKMQEIQDDQSLYYFALNHIKDKNNREIFMNIPEKDRVWWLKSAFENRML